MIEAGNKNISRRGILTSAAIGTVALMGGGGVLGVMAGEAEVEIENAAHYWTKERTQQYLCSQIHAAKSQELKDVLGNNALDAEYKNKALATASCPSCNVQITAAG